MAKKIKIPRQYSLVKFDYDSVPTEYHKYYKKTFKKNDTWIFFGDIPNQQGHCILMHAKTKKFEAFWHTDNFIELTDEEV